jgi:DNA repair protein RecO (recombination protein O)
MILKTSAIVLRRTNYGDSSLIVQFYSADFGLFSAMVRGARKKKGKMKANLFEPLSLLEMVMYRKENHQMATLKETRQSHHLSSIRSNIYKTTIALFCAEVLQKTMKEETPNPAQFSFLVECILWLELSQEHFANFPLAFMCRLTKYLGFLPNEFEGEYFDYLEGQFVKTSPIHEWQSSGAIAQALLKLFQCDLETAAEIKLNHKQRRLLLTELIRFYSLHIEGFTNLKSKEVLEQLMD